MPNSDARQRARFAPSEARRGVARPGQHSVQQPCSPAVSSRRQSRRVALLRTEVCTENGSRQAIYLCNISFAAGRQVAKHEALDCQPGSRAPRRHAPQLCHSKRTRLEKLLEKCARNSRVAACHDSTLSHCHRLPPCVARDSAIRTQVLLPRVAIDSKTFTEREKRAAKRLS